MEIKNYITIYLIFFGLLIYQDYQNTNRYNQLIRNQDEINIFLLDAITKSIKTDNLILDRSAQGFLMVDSVFKEKFDTTIFKHK